MAKKLSEMTNEELWELFPIILSDYNDSWPVLFESEKDVLVSAIGAGNIVRIDHIGSTAVPELLSKPTIDILIQVADDTDLDDLTESISSAGYIYEPQPGNPAPHMMFMKGYTNNGFVGQAYHVHIRYEGDWDEISFRDYLREHPHACEEYTALKIKLQKEYEHDRDGYTEAKSEFIEMIIYKIL